MKIGYFVIQKKKKKIQCLQLDSAFQTGRIMDCPPTKIYIKKKKQKNKTKKKKKQHLYPLHPPAKKS